MSQHRLTEDKNPAISSAFLYQLFLAAFALAVCPLLAALTKSAAISRCCCPVDNAVYAIFSADQLCYHVGLDSLYYSKITEGANGVESYGTPSVLAKAISADLSVELNKAILYADDGAAEIVKEFKSGTISLVIDDIGASVASDLTGA